jgi:hypothetical protein
MEEKLTKKEMLKMLDEMIKSFDNLPQHAMLSFVTQSELCSVLMLLSAILRSDCIDES